MANQSPPTRNFQVAADRGAPAVVPAAHAFDAVDAALDAGAQRVEAAPLTEADRELARQFAGPDDIYTLDSPKFRRAFLAEIDRERREGRMP